jgi:hypothetical protein
VSGADGEKGAGREWTVGIVAETVTGDVVLRMTEPQAAALRDGLAWLMEDTP